MTHSKPFLPHLKLLLASMALLIAAPAFAAWQTPGVPTQQLAATQDAAATPVGITATVREPFFKITAEDVEKAVAEQLELQAVETKAEVKLNAGSPPVFHSADHALKPVIHALQIDPQAKRWQAQVYVVANGKTEIVRPISGAYGALINVPVLTRQLRQLDIIEASDITLRPTPERQLRKDTITDMNAMIGRSPRAMISANRPVRASEISSPVVIKKGDMVEMTYTTPHIHIKTTGIALEDGSKDSLIRVKNEKSEKAVSGRVQAAGHVEVNSDSTL